MCVCMSFDLLFLLLLRLCLHFYSISHTKHFERIEWWLSGLAWISVKTMSMNTEIMSAFKRALTHHYAKNISCHFIFRLGLCIVGRCYCCCFYFYLLSISKYHFHSFIYRSAIFMRERHCRGTNNKKNKLTMAWTTELMTIKILEDFSFLS